MVVSIEKHLRSFFQSSDEIQFHQWSGPIKTRLPGFRVMVIPPGPKTGLWTYASLGACTGQDDEYANKFFILAPQPSDSHVELVTMIAHYHADCDPTYRLSLGHTVPIGRAWLPGSSCEHILVSTPYPFGPELEHCENDRGCVRILWLLPITERERAFKIKHGLEALEQRFENAGLEYWRPDRASVA